MLRALMTAASGMKAQQMQVDTIANNIANVNTQGFKRSKLTFRSMLYQTIREPGARTSANQVDTTGLQIGSGTEVAGSIKIFQQGELEPTGGQLDLAIQGDASRSHGTLDAMSRLFVIRHGQASFLADDYDQLSPLGEEQGRALGAYWAPVLT